MQRDFDGLKYVFSTALCAEDVPKTIIFCHTKEITCKVYEFLVRASPKRDYVAMYHANLTTEKNVYDNFKTGQIRCISATIAFGMVGILILPYIPINDHLTKL